jgi:Helix-turn-helix family
VDAARQLSRLFEPYHSIAYYCPEITRFTDAGFRGWWHAYFAYRSAPLGVVPASVVAATFYNFAPRMVARAIPGAWEVLPPEQVLALRLEVVDEALRRVLGERTGDGSLARAAQLARRAVEGCDVAGRPLYAAHAARAWPDRPHLELWWACTLLREHRGDGHGVALAAADVDGTACHVLMVAQGHGNRASILPIRGWTNQEWAAATARLEARGWLDAAGAFTAKGRRARQAIEAHTDALASEPLRRLGPDGVTELDRLITPYVHVLREHGNVPGRWPPPHLRRDEGATPSGAAPS